MPLPVFTAVLVLGTLIVALAVLVLTDEARPPVDARERLRRRRRGPAATTQPGGRAGPARFSSPRLASSPPPVGASWRGQDHGS